MKSRGSKVFHSLKNIRSTAYHHYGKSYASVFRMAYHSLFRINEFILFERILDNSVVPVGLDPEYMIVKPTKEQLEDIRRNRELPREFFYDQFHGVGRCYVVLHNERPAYIHWVYVRGDPNRFLELEDGVAELNYITTLPEHRGRKLMGRVMVNTMKDLKDKGFTKVVSVVNALNPPALRSMAAAGFKEIRRIKTIGYFNRKYRIAGS